MNENSAIRMVDILALEPAAQNSSLPLLIVLPVTCLLILWLGLRYYREPMRQLQRQLKMRQLSPREAAHRIARIALLNTQQHAQLQQMRFSRASPTPQAVLSFMRQLKGL